MLRMILITGFLNGGVFAILAIGFSLVFGAAKILNLSHTAIYMATAFILFTAVNWFHHHVLGVVILAIPISGLLAMFLYMLLIDRVKQHQTVVMIISLAVAILFQDVGLLIFGGNYRSISNYIPGYMEVMGIRVLYQYFVSIAAVFLVVIATCLMLYRTTLGKAIRAVSDDMEAATLVGINVGSVCLMAMGLSGVLAGIAAVVAAPLTPVYPLMWMHILLTVLAAVVLGGLGSIKGSIIGSFILGFSESCVVFLVPNGAFLKGAVAILVMMVILILKPEGLFGVVFEEERL